MEEEHDVLWAFYRAAQYSYTGEADRWESLMRRLAPRVGTNAYYRWFVGL